MKKLIAVILLLLGSFSYAETKADTRTEATVALNCDHQVAGTSCPAKYAAPCKTLFCESKAPEASPKPSQSETDK